MCKPLIFNKFLDKCNNTFGAISLSTSKNVSTNIDNGPMADILLYVGPPHGGEVMMIYHL